MAPRDRSRGRNVHIYDLKDPSTILGGLILEKGLTNANLYSMVEIIVEFSSDFELQYEAKTKLEKDNEPLQPGNYYISSIGPFSINNEHWLLWTISLSTGDRLKSFRDAIRSRDRRCVMSGKHAIRAYLDNWTGFEAAHIFPPAYEGDWVQYDFNRWITIRPESGGPINSIQNGLLLDSTLHQLFDTYDLSINPDDNYKIG